MRAHEPASILSEGDALLRRLFEIAARRLQERGISMHYSPGVLDWLLDQPDWRASLNPLRALDGSWHRQIAAMIERLLLEGQLRSGSALTVSMGEAPTGPRIQFDSLPSPEGGS
jgi:hypothetical protein